MEFDKQAQPGTMPLEHENIKGYEGDENVPAKYRGTTADQRDMAMLGKKQVLRVSFPVNDSGCHIQNAD